MAGILSVAGIIQRNRLSSVGRWGARKAGRGGRRGVGRRTRRREVTALPTDRCAIGASEGQSNCPPTGGVTSYRSAKVGTPHRNVLWNVVGRTQVGIAHYWGWYFGRLPERVLYLHAFKYLSVVQIFRE